MRYYYVWVATYLLALIGSVVLCATLGEEAEQPLWMVIAIVWGCAVSAPSMRRFVKP